MSGSFNPSTFEQNERSDARPVTLYTFARGAVVWRYTDQAGDVTDSGVTYRAAAITHGDYQKTDESAAGETTVTCAEATPIVADLDAIGLDGLPITCTIRQTHALVGTPSTAVRFKGRVTARKIANGECEFTVASLAGFLDRPLLRLACPPTCQWSVYGKECGVDPAGFTTTGCAVSAISGLVLTVADAALQADGYYTAGYVVVETGSAAGEKVFIDAHVGSSLTCLTRIPSGLTTSDTVSIVAGCDGLEATCRTKFNNIAYFGGFAEMPEVNPFQDADGSAGSSGWGWG
jgi:uncharacterized phage protein (TIGR02218 family)